MSEAKHTPGPWMAAHATAGGLGKPVICEWFVRRDGDNLAIAADVIDPDTEQPSEANARLIAAAPELLDALREIADDYADRFDLESPSTNPGIKAAIQQARAAIAKVTGRTA